MLDFLKDPTAQTVVAGLASLFLPRLLSRFGVKIPGVTPTLPTPQIPTADAQLVEMERWATAVIAGDIRMDAEDVRVLDRVAVLVAKLVPAK